MLNNEKTKKVSRGATEEHIMVRTTLSLSYQVSAVVPAPQQGYGQQANKLLLCCCCSTVLVLVVLVLHVPRVGVCGGGDDEEGEGEGNEHDEGSWQKARHLPLPQLADSWNLDQGLEVIPPSMALFLAKTSCRLVSSWCQPSGKVDDKLPM